MRPTARSVSALARLTPRATPTPAARSYATLSSVTYTRKGDQPAVAPLAAKAVSKTAGGVSVATLDDKGPVSSLAVVLAVGSRHESPEKLGAAHFLKSVLIRNLPNDTIVRTIREAEFRGNTLYSSLARENLLLVSDFLRDDLVDVVPLLLKSVLNSSFEPYEFLDAQPQLALESEAALADPYTHALETVHSLAFRTGLGNSLFATEHNAEELTRADLLTLAAQGASKLTIVGTGIAHDELLSLVNDSLSALPALPTVSAASPKTSYFGGEARVDAGPHAPAHLLIAFPAPVDTPALSVLRALLGGAPRVKWGAPGGLLAAAKKGAAAVDAHSYAYTDAGLLVLHVENGAPADVKAAAQAAVDVLKGVAAGTISEAQLAGAKKAAVLASVAAGREQRLRDIAAGVLSTGAFETEAELAAKIAKVSAADVVKVAKAASSAKPTVVAHGSSRLPYADEIKF